MRVCPVCRSQFPSGSNFCPHDGHRLEDLDAQAPSHDPFVGTVLDRRYKIESRLGSGGMGDVYAARHVVIDKPVAVKILRQAYSQDPRQAERFIREARAASRIGHPNIVDVTDFGRLENGQIYFVMEFLAGETLGRALRDHGAFTCRRALNLAIQICHALTAAHAKGIVHRDLKPENIFIVNPITRSLDGNAGGLQQDRIKLLDFGIAKISWDVEGRRLTKVGSVFGTPQYMSPEQASGSDTDHRSDIYSLGCITYEMLTGEVPFLADTFMGTLTKQMFEEPVPPRQLRPDLQIPTPLEQVILTAMHKDPDQRFQSMKAVAAALESCFMEVESGPVRRATPGSVVVRGGPEGDEITDGKRETVHLLMEPSKSRQGRAPALRRSLVAGGVIVLVAAGAFLLLRQRQEGPVPGPDAGSRAAALPDATLLRADQRMDPTPGDAGSTVRLLLRSVPSGARIFEGRRLLGKTPREITVSREGERQFVFRLRGYRPAVLRRVFDQNGTHLVRLVRRRQQRQDGGARPTRFGSPGDLRNPFRKRPRTGK